MSDVSVCAAMAIDRDVAPQAGKWPGPAGGQDCRGLSCREVSPEDLVALHRLEQRLEVAFTKALVTLALDDLEEDRADRELRKGLQQAAAIRAGRAVDQDRVPFQLRQVLAVPGQAFVHSLVVAVGRRRHELDAARAERVDRGMDIVRAERDMLDALAVIGGEIFLDLRLVRQRIR